MEYACLKYKGFVVVLMKEGNTTYSKAYDINNPSVRVTGSHRTVRHFINIVRSWND